jgi:type VI secretion system protein ImpK
VVSERAYASTLSHIAPRKLPTLSRWTVLFLLCTASLLAVSELLWLWQSWPVRQVLQPGAVDASGAYQR